MARQIKHTISEQHIEIEELILKKPSKNIEKIIQEEKVEKEEEKYEKAEKFESEEKP